MTSSRRELLAALGAAWVLASLSAAPATTWWLSRDEQHDPGLAPEIDAELAHVLTRCGFGVRPSAVLGVTSAPQWIEQQLEPDSIDDRDFERRLRRLETLALPVAEVYEFHEHVARRELQAGVLLGAVYSARQLRESLTEFWRDHFSLSVTKGECAWLATSFERDALRPHALGRFRDLLRAVLLHPAMLWYLDGRLNRADSGQPNENYARELLELHTLGLGAGYTQRDVQEVARALSGWTSRALGESRKGQVLFDAARHDHGTKQVLGVELPGGLGADEVERVLDVVCAHPATAQHIARKLCVRYIADEPSPTTVDIVSAAFTHGGGDTRATLRVLVALPEFAAARGAKLKRPLHFVASALRACDAECTPSSELLAYLERLGHAPYQWPTPDGYPLTSMHWRSGLLWRWRFADDLARGAVPGVRVEAQRVFERCAGRASFAMRCGAGSSAKLLANGDDSEALSCVLASPEFQRC